MIIYNIMIIIFIYSAIVMLFTLTTKTTRSIW